MSEESNVTFVGGKAVEQSEGLETNLEVDEREAAKEAVRKAIKEAGEESAKTAKEKKDNDPFKPPGAKKDSEKSRDKDDDEGGSGPERGPDGKFLPKAGKSDPETGSAGKPGKSKDSDDSEDLDLDKASVKELLRAREKAAQIKKKASEDVSKERQEIERARQEFQRQQYEFQQQQAALQRQYQALQELRKDPARAVKEIGYDPEQFVLDLAMEGTPEGKANRQIRELQAQLQQMQAYQQQQLQAQQEYQRQLQQRQVQQHRYNAVTEFVNLGMSEDKYPHVSNFYKGNERALVAFGDLVAEEFRGLTNGREASYADILDYIEDQLAEKAKSWYSKFNGSQKQKTRVVEEEPEEKPKSKGKALSPDASGERRSLKAKSLKDLDGDERLEAAKQAVAVALASSKKDD